MIKVGTKLLTKRDLSIKDKFGKITVLIKNEINVVNQILSIRYNGNIIKKYNINGCWFYEDYKIGDYYFYDYFEEFALYRNKRIDDIFL